MFGGGLSVISKTLANALTAFNQPQLEPSSLVLLLLLLLRKSWQTLRHKFIRVSAPFLFDLHTQSPPPARVKPLRTVGTALWFST